jgi:tetratricopeptide (TPR) repeat protein
MISLKGAFTHLIIFFNLNPLIFSLFLLLALRKKIYGEYNHPEVSTTLYSIAQQYSKLGQYEKALKAFQDVLSNYILLKKP